MSCIFSPSGASTVPKVIEEFVADSTKSVLRLSLQNVSFGHNAREIVANAIGRHLLDMARSGAFKQSPVLVIVDEAHQFLNKTIGDDSCKVELKAFGLIAKEGRKHGLNICIATQRPRDIPDDVLSQMGTLIVHRLINDRDRSVVESASGEIDRSAAAFLPTLGPGEAIIIGVDIPVPLSIRIQRPDRAPDSTGPDHEIYWSNEVKLTVDDSRQVGGSTMSIIRFDEGEFQSLDGPKIGPRSHINWGTNKHEIGEGSCISCDSGEWKCVEVSESSGSITLIRVG